MQNVFPRLYKYKKSEKENDFLFIDNTYKIIDDFYQPQALKRKAENITMFLQKHLGLFRETLPCFLNNKKKRQRRENAMLKKTIFAKKARFRSCQSYSIGYICDNLLPVMVKNT